MTKPRISFFRTLTYLTLTTNLCSKFYYYYFQFIGKETRVQRVMSLAQDHTTNKWWARIWTWWWVNLNHILLPLCSTPGTTNRRQLDVMHIFFVCRRCLTMCNVTIFVVMRVSVCDKAACQCADGCTDRSGICLIKLYFQCCHLVKDQVIFISIEQILIEFLLYVRLK